LLAACDVGPIGATSADVDVLGQVDLVEQLRAFTDPARRFPPVDLVRAAAGMFVDQVTQQPNWVKPWQVLEEGRDFIVGVAAGAVSVRSIDHERRARTAGRGRGVGYSSEDVPSVTDAVAGWKVQPTGAGRFPWEQRAAEHDSQGRSLIEAAAAGQAGRDRDFPEINWGRRGSRAITEWSRKSRVNMTRCLSELDYAPLLAAGRTPAMLTLTYPAEWESCASSGEVVKAHVEALRKRWARAFRCDKPPLLWKLEFQRRGAPHFHMFIVEPVQTVVCECKECIAERIAGGGVDDEGEQLRVRFRLWVLHNWADVVAHPDPEQRRRHRLAGTRIDYKRGASCTDPKRLAVYFTKHGGAAGGKEYQHQVPLAWQSPGNGPGRFWGHPGLKRVRCEVYVDAERYVQVRRTLRRIARSRRLTSSWQVPRGDQVLEESTGELRQPKRKVTRRRKVPCSAGGLAGGFLLVNNGPALAEQLSRLGEAPSRDRMLWPAGSCW